MINEEIIKKDFYEAILPQNDLIQLEQYLKEGKRPSNFLYAVLSNYLFGSLSCGDKTRIFLLPHYVKYIYNYFPQESFGNAAKIERWMRDRIIEKNREVEC